MRSVLRMLGRGPCGAVLFMLISNPNHICSISTWLVVCRSWVCMDRTEARSGAVSHFRFLYVPYAYAYGYVRDVSSWYQIRPCPIQWLGCFDMIIIERAATLRKQCILRTPEHRLINLSLAHRLAAWIGLTLDKSVHSHRHNSLPSTVWPRRT